MKRHLTYRYPFDGDYKRLEAAVLKRIMKFGYHSGDFEIDVTFPADAYGPYSSTKQVSAEVKVTW